MTTSTKIPQHQPEPDVVDLEQGTEVGAVEEQAAKYLNKQYPLTVPFTSGATSEMPHPLHYACYDSASLEVIQYIVNKGGKDKLIAKDGEGRYPLHLACMGEASSLDLIQYLINLAPHILSEPDRLARLAPAPNDDSTSVDGPTPRQSNEDTGDTGHTGHTDESRN